MKCHSDLFKKQKIQTTNNQVATNTYLSTIEPKIKKRKQTKQTRRTEIESWIWRGF